MSTKRQFLFLQGVCSPFFRCLAVALQRRGHRVHKINYTVGDRIYWRMPDATSYRGSRGDLREFYLKQYKAHGVTDIVLFGDCRPVHRPAIDLARQSNINVHVFEEGYFRPYWVTLERNGVNGHSTLPRDPDYYRMRAKQVPRYDNGSAFISPFWKRAAYDIGYNFWAGLNPILHRGVQRHVPYSPAVEYASYVRKSLGAKLWKHHAHRTQRRLTVGAGERPYYLFPLQLTTDSQITHHSDFSTMSEAISHVIQSFSQHAPEHARLLIKAHPLDPGLHNYSRQIRTLGKAHGIKERLTYIDGGHLPTLINATEGVVTINSTVGASAILHGRPTKALGRAIYNMPGLTYQGDLNEFWCTKEQPDISLFKSFRNVVIHDTQINGGFYCRTGIELAVENALPRILA
ncbi:Capsule polysaccharide biosynthesis protein [compost metagenome]